VAADRDRDRKGLSGVCPLEFAEVLGPAAMRQPAHDQLVPADQLLAVDRQVDPRLVGAASDDQSPGDQRAGVLWPASGNGQLAEVDVRAIHHVCAPGRAVLAHRGHVSQPRKPWQGLQRGTQAVGQVGLAQKGQVLTQFAQRLPGLQLQRRQDAPLIAEQITQHVHVVAFHVFEQQGRPVAPQATVAQRRHLQPRRDGLGHGFQLTGRPQFADKLAEVAERLAVDLATVVVKQLVNRHGPSPAAAEDSRCRRPMAAG
jgi:hypothetical protein